MGHSRTSGLVRRLMKLGLRVSLPSKETAIGALGGGTLGALASITEPMPGREYTLGDRLKMIGGGALAGGTVGSRFGRTPTRSLPVEVDPIARRAEQRVEDIIMFGSHAKGRAARAAEAARQAKEEASEGFSWGVDRIKRELAPDVPLLPPHKPKTGAVRSWARSAVPGALLGGATAASMSEHDKGRAALGGALLGGFTGAGVALPTNVVLQGIGRAGRESLDEAKHFSNRADDIAQKLRRMYQSGRVSSFESDLLRGNLMDALRQEATNKAKLEGLAAMPLPSRGRTIAEGAAAGLGAGALTGTSFNRQQQELRDADTEQLRRWRRSMKPGASENAQIEIARRKEERAMAKAKAKLSALDINKRGEIAKQVVSNFERALPDIEEKEPELPSEVLEEMAKNPKDSLSSALSTGVVLKPKEFQKVILINAGNRPLADELDERGITFRPQCPHRGGSFPLGNEILPSIIQRLLPLLGSRSSLWPPLHRRSFSVTIICKKRPEGETVDHPLMDKLSADYAAYRKEALSKAASLVPRALTEFPEVLAPIYGDVDEVFEHPELVKSGGDMVESVLGVFPATYLNRAYMPGPVSEVVAQDPSCRGLRLSSSLA